MSLSEVQWYSQNLEKQNTHQWEYTHLTQKHNRNKSLPSLDFSTAQNYIIYGQIIIKSISISLN